MKKIYLIGFLGFLFSFNLFALIGYAATDPFEVNMTDDIPDANIGDMICDVDTTMPGKQCTLRAAIQEANASLDDDDIITLRADTYILTQVGKNEDIAATGDLDIIDDLIIQGEGATSTVIDGDQIDRIFHIIGAIDVQIHGVTLQNGATDSGEDGGAIFNSSNANTILQDSIVQNNTAAQWGGGIANNSSAKILINNVQVRDNVAGSIGGGVDNHNGTMEIANSIIANNEAVAKSGGGVYNDGQLTIENSWIKDNTALLDGGGIFNFETLSLKASSLTGNTAGDDAAGLFNYGDLILENVTLTENVAGRVGGGFFNLGTSDITNVTIAANEAISAGGFFNDGFANMANTIIAVNIGGNCERFHVIDSLGHNLEDGTSCVLTATNDISNGMPALETVADNGGIAPTMALLSTSDALDNADADFCPFKDARGATRPQGNGCDIGAYEEASADVSIEKRLLTPLPIYAGSTVVYELLVRNAGDSEAIDVVITDTLPAGTAYIDTPSNNWTCQENSGVVVCETALIARNGVSDPLVMTVVMPPDAGQINNNATTLSALPDPDVSNNSTSLLTMVDGAAELGVRAIPNTTQINVGDPLTFTVLVSNTGPSAAAQVTMTLAIPTNFASYSGYAGDDWACQMVTGELVCTADTLATGTHEIVLTMTALQGGVDVFVPINITAGSYDDYLPNNSTTAFIGNTITPRVDLAIDVIDVSDPILAGEIFTYTLDATNFSAPSATGVQVVHELPIGMIYAGYTGVGWMCTAVDHIVTCTLPMLAGTTTEAVEIAVIAPDDSGLLTTRSTIASDTDELNESNNADNFNVTVQAAADLSVTGNFLHELGETVVPGEEIIYTIKAENNGASTAVSSLFTVTVPTGAAYISANGAWSCGSDGVDVICARSLFAADTADTIDLRVIATVTATVSGTVTISSQTIDPDLTNNSSVLGESLPTSVILSSLSSLAVIDVWWLVIFAFPLFSATLFLTVARRYRSTSV